MESERRIDTARELGKLNQQVETLATGMAKLTAVVEDFTKTKHQVQGAVRMAKILGAAVTAACAGLLYLVAKLADIFR